MAIFPGGIATDANLYIAKNNLSTTLNGSLTSSGDNTSGSGIAVASTTGFPTAGFITIDTEAIAYTGITGNNFTGITRGADGTTAASHANTAQVFHNIVAAHHNSLKDEVKAIEGSVQPLLNTAGYIIGSIVQTVQVVDTTTKTSSTTVQTATNTAATITPKASTHKIKVTISGITQTGGVNYDLHVTLYRGVTNLDATGNGFSVSQSPALNQVENCSFSYLDSPATTGATTYTVYIQTPTQSAGGNWNVYLGSAVILLEEIAA